MQDILIQIENTYGLELTFQRKITKGTLSDNCVLANDKSMYFLKKYRYNNADKITEIHSVKKYFSNGGIPVIIPILALDGSTFFKCNESYFALFPYIDGRYIEGKDLNDRALVQMAEMLGKIHLLGRDSKIIVNNYFKIEKKENTDKLIKDILIKINEIKTPSEFDKIALKDVELQNKLLLCNSIKFEDLNLINDHLIHGDYLDPNIFFNDDNGIEYVFDFEKTCYAPRSFELFRSMFYTIIKDEFRNIELKKMKLYLEAYSSIYPISKVEIEKGIKLFFLKYIHGFWMTSEHYLYNNYRVDKLLPEHQARMSYFSNNLDNLINFLTT